MPIADCARKKETSIVGLSPLSYVFGNGAVPTDTVDEYMNWEYQLHAEQPAVWAVSPSYSASDLRSTWLTAGHSFQLDDYRQLMQAVCPFARWHQGSQRRRSSGSSSSSAEPALASDNEWSTAIRSAAGGDRAASWSHVDRILGFLHLAKKKLSSSCCGWPTACLVKHSDLQQILRVLLRNQCDCICYVNCVSIRLHV